MAYDPNGPNLPRDTGSGFAWTNVLDKVFDLGGKVAPSLLGDDSAEKALKLQQAQNRAAREQASSTQRLLLIAGGAIVAVVLLVVLFKK